MKHLIRLGVLMGLIFVTFVSVASQERVIQAEEIQQETLQTKSVDNAIVKSPPPSPDQQPAPSSTQSPKNTYVFPTSRQRFKRYVISTVGPFSLSRSVALAGIEQWDNTPLEWGQGAEGYGKRLVSSVGRNAIRQTVSYGLSEALRLDTGFKKSTRKGFWPRLSDALIQNVTSRTRSGRRVLSAPIFAGAYTGAIIAAETWYPERYSYKDGLRGGTYSLASGFALNVVREFLFNW